MKGVRLDRYERLLLAKRQELLAGTLRTLLATGKEEGHGGDPTDRATEEVQTALQVHLSQSDSHLLRAIDEALARIKHGTFGVCEACKRPIAEARLKAVPWTRLRLSPGLRQTVKPLFAVRWNLIVQRRPLPARCQPAGEAEAGSAGEQPAKE